MVKESIPKEGQTIKIQSYKHDGNIHRVWSETTILKGTEPVSYTHLTLPTKA